MSLKYAIPLLFGFALCCPMSAPASTVLELEYGQSKDVWKVLHSINDAKGNLSELSDILNNNYGKYQAAFAEIGGNYRSILIGQPDALFSRLVIGLDVESALIGLVRNPVLPELNAAGIAAAISHFDGIGSLGDVKTRVGLSLGYGLEKQVSAVSTDLLEKIPINTSPLKMLGLDLELRRQFSLGDDLLLKLLAVDQESYFSGINSSAPTLSDEKLPSFTHHWQSRGDIILDMSSLHFILGPHPLPINLLPRVWDRVANTYAWPELGAMFGIGLNQTLRFGSSVSMSVTGGLYAGYFGAGLDFRYRKAQLSLGTWKVENSAAYQTLGERLYNAALLFAF